MNPSANGWLSKLLSILDTHQPISYAQLRASGFIYGTNTSASLTNWQNGLKLTKEELAKINLIASLYSCFKLNQPQATEAAFIDFTIAFYTTLEAPKSGKLSWLTFNETEHTKLEKIINKRVQTNSTLLERNFSNILTNAFLNIDVESYQHYLKSGANSLSFARNFEATLINIISIALQLKSNKTNTEHLLLKLIESSLRYQSKSLNLSATIDELDLKFIQTETAKLYLLDVACMSIFSDEKIEKKELEFIYSFSKRLDLEQIEAKNAIKSIKSFIDIHRSEIPYFNASNPLKHFYDRTHRSTTTLLVRNKKRLVQEIYESKELLVLLSKSTHTDLNEQEKHQVKQQLIDIFKSIPSLAIFALPGGGVLLPIIIKFIPKLLPSSFNENNEQ